MWATEIEIDALALMLDRPIVLMEGGSKPKIYNGEAKSNPIFLHQMNMTSETPEVRASSSASSSQSDSSVTPHLIKAHYFESCLPFNGLNVNEIHSQIKREVEKANGAK